MNVLSKHLLNSAESILRDRRNDPRAEPPRAESPGQKVVERTRSALSGDALQARILDLQAGLNRTQREHSREQARAKALSEPNPARNAARLFDGEPLLPELTEGKDPAELLGNTRERVDQLKQQLKGLQVEMENLLALNFEPPESAIALNADALLRAGGIRELDPERVARLTRG